MQRAENQEIINKMTNWQRKQMHVMIRELAKIGIPENKIEARHLEPILQLRKQTIKSEG